MRSLLHEPLRFRQLAPITYAITALLSMRWHRDYRGRLQRVYGVLIRLPTATPNALSSADSREAVTGTDLSLRQNLRDLVASRGGRCHRFQYTTILETDGRAPVR